MSSLCTVMLTQASPPTKILFGANKQTQLKSKSTETIPWNTPTSTTKDWNTLATDVSAMEYVHLDYKTDDATALDFYLISENPTVENAYTLSIVTGDWQSIDIPLSVYTANLDRVLQFKTTGNGTVYLDNLYFWKAPAAAGTDISLSALTVDGSSIADFGALKTSYSVELPAGTTVVPTVAATTDRHKCKCCRNGCNKHSWNNNRCDHSPRRK